MLSIVFLLWYDGVLFLGAVAVVNQIVTKLFGGCKLCAFYNTALIADVVSVINLYGHTPTVVQSVVVNYLLHCSISFCIYCIANIILQSPIEFQYLQDGQRCVLQNLSYRQPIVSALSSSADVGLCGLKFFIVLSP